MKLAESGVIQGGVSAGIHPGSDSWPSSWRVVQEFGKRLGLDVCEFTTAGRCAFEVDASVRVDFSEARDSGILLATAESLDGAMPAEEAAAVVGANRFLASTRGIFVTHDALSGRTRCHAVLWIANLDADGLDHAVQRLLDAVSGLATTVHVKPSADWNEVTGLPPQRYLVDLA